jgi:hypothetical protein
MLKFENRRKQGLILGEIFNIPCVINHRHDQDLDLWNGTIMQNNDVNYMFTSDFDFIVEHLYHDIYLQKLIKNCPDISNDIKNVDIEHLKTNELGLTSKYLMVRDHVFAYHLSKEFNKHPYLEFIHTNGNDETIGFLINIKTYPGPIYLDTIIHEVFNIISPIFDVEWHHVKRLNVGNYGLPNDLRYLVAILSETYKLTLWDFLGKPINRKNIEYIYKEFDKPTEIFNSMAFVGRAILLNRPPFCRNIQY